MLPAEVPVRDVHHPARRAVRQRRDALDLPRAVVGVRLNGEHVDVDRQRVGIRDHVPLLAGRDVDALRSET